MKKKIEDLLKAIERRLDIYYKDRIIPTFDYNLGYILYLSYCTNFQEGLKPKILNQFERGINFISSNSVDSTLFKGFTGLAWLSQHLYNNGTISVDDKEYIQEGLDPHIYKAIALYEDNQNYDLLYGMIGLGLYYLEKPIDGSVQIL